MERWTIMGLMTLCVPWLHASGVSFDLQAPFEKVESGSKT
jgi:hypothetical protein